MKILLLHTKYQFKGGEDTVVEQELELLKQHNVVEILYFQNYGGWKGALQFLVSIWNISSSKKVKKKIQEFQPDLVHVHNWHFAAGALVFRKIHQLGIPIVHTVHNYRLLCPSAILLNEGKLFTESLRKTFPWKAVYKKVYRSSLLQTFWLAFVVWFHKKIGTWKKIDSYVCLTSFAVNLFEQSSFNISKEYFSVKPNFVVSNRINYIERKNHFLFIGRLSEEKGIENLLAAFKGLPLLLKIAGNGPLKDKIISETKQHSNIIYLGSLSKLEVTKELYETQALILPSICFEGMPMTILEAFSTSTPVITSNLGAMTSLVLNESNGFLFDPGNVNDIRQTVLKFNSLSDNQKKQIGINAFDNYQTNYSPDSQFLYFNAIYNGVLKK